MYAALPVDVQRCAMGCALYLRRQGLTAVAIAAPDRVASLVCRRCFSALIAVEAAR